MCTYCKFFLPHACFFGGCRVLNYFHVRSFPNLILKRELMSLLRLPNLPSLLIFKSYWVFPKNMPSGENSFGVSDSGGGMKRVHRNLPILRSLLRLLPQHQKSFPEKDIQLKIVKAPPPLPQKVHVGGDESSEISCSTNS